MTDADEKAKAEKLAAAKKRVEQMKKKKGNVKKEEIKDTSSESTKPKGNETSLPKPDLASDTNEVKEGVTVDKLEIKDASFESTKPKGNETSLPKPDLASDTKEMKEDVTMDKPEIESESQDRRLSVSHLSKLRSSNFRETAALGVPYSPRQDLSLEGDTSKDLYRKQTGRIEELEQENKRLTKEVSEAEKRWRTLEEELEDLREAEVSANKEAVLQVKSVEEIEKLRTDNAALKRQNAQLLARSPRHGSTSSVSATLSADYESALASKFSTIESMEMEISSLKSIIEQYTTNSSEKAQVVALETKLFRAEKAAATAQAELNDLKRNLDRTTEKAVKEGSERVSAEIKLRSLERELEEKSAQNEELLQKVDFLEKKVATLATLHKEHGARFQAQKRALEKAENESNELRIRLTQLQKENSRNSDTSYMESDGLDDLENERYERLERKVRDMEEENSKLRRGIWSQRRSEIDKKESFSVVSPGTNFTEVDLRSEISPKRNLSQVGKGRYSDYVAEDDELLDFDEEAFRIARESEAKRRLERIKDIKRGLQDWKGWRLDLVVSRIENLDGHPIVFEI